MARLKPTSRQLSNGSWDVLNFTVALATRQRPELRLHELRTHPPFRFARPDGRVVVTAANTLPASALILKRCGVWTDIGFMYDPVTNSWSAQISEPFVAATW
jgi:hypothetical protein